MRKLLISLALLLAFGAPAQAADDPRTQVRVALASLKVIMIWPTFKCAALAIGGRDPQWLGWGVAELHKIRPHAVELAQTIINDRDLWNKLDLDGEAGGTFPFVTDPTFLAGMWFQAVWDKQRMIMNSDLLIAGSNYELVWRARFLSQRCDKPFSDWIFDFGSAFQR